MMDAIAQIMEKKSSQLKLEECKFGPLEAESHPLVFLACTKFLKYECEPRNNVNFIKKYFS